MKEIRKIWVNKKEVPVLISDEKEALLAAKAAGGALIGLWTPGTAIEELSPAPYIAENAGALTEEFVERVARRHLGLPWKICETERLLIREMAGADFDEIWWNQIGRGFGTVEELEAYTKHQYSFYEFGFWAVLEKESGNLAGVAGFHVPEAEVEAAVNENEAKEKAIVAGDGNEAKEKAIVAGEKNEAGSRSRDGESILVKVIRPQEEESDSGRPEEKEEVVLELGYHIFPEFRRLGYGLESCRAILKYGEDALGLTRCVVRILKTNQASLALARRLGFEPF